MKIRANIAIIQLAFIISFSGCCLLAPATYRTTEYQAVHEAALNGNTTEIEELLLTNPKLVNMGDYDKNTPLHLAALHGRLETVKSLLAAGAEVNASNSVKMTPLHLAVKQGFTDIVRELLSHKPNLSIKDSRGWTALAWAEKAHKSEIADLLRENGAVE